MFGSSKDSFNEAILSEYLLALLRYYEHNLYILVFTDLENSISVLNSMCFLLVQNLQML